MWGISALLISETVVSVHCFCISVATHVTVRDVHVTQQTNCTIILQHKLVPIVNGSIPIHSEITAHDMKNAMTSPGLCSNTKWCFITKSQEYHMTLAVGEALTSVVSKLLARQWL